MKTPKQMTRPARPRRGLAWLVTAVAVLVLAGAALLTVRWDATVTAAAFADARGNQTMLRNFLKNMPKGGDLHVHLTGAVYAERYIEWAIADNLCLRLSDNAFVNPPCNPPAKSPSKRQPISAPMKSVADDQAMRDRIVNALSMRDFRPTPAEPSGHDHFFATFGRFSAVSDHVSTTKSSSCCLLSGPGHAICRADDVVFRLHRASANGRRNEGADRAEGQTRRAGKGRARRLRRRQKGRARHLCRRHRAKTRVRYRQMQAGLQSRLSLHRPSLAQ